MFLIPSRKIDIAELISISINILVSIYYDNIITNMFL